MNTEQATMPPAAETQIEGNPEQLGRLRPQIWVGATSDYEGERRHGAWIDAVQEQEALQADIRKIIDRTPDPARQSWHIHDVRGFGRWNPEQRYGLPTVVRIARGIAYYGWPYSALVHAVGADSQAARSDRFEQTYLGSWPSLKDFVDHFATEAGWHRRLADLPESMRPFVRLDLGKLTRIAQAELLTIQHDNGLWVFEPKNW